MSTSSACVSITGYVHAEEIEPEGPQFCRSKKRFHAAETERLPWLTVRSEPRSATEANKHFDPIS